MTDRIVGGDIVAAVSGGVFSLQTVIPDYEASEVLDHSPASAIATYIISTDKMTAPSAGDSWPLYISVIPDNPNVPINAGGVYDTTPVKDAREMYGPIHQHYGVQLMIRSSDYNTGWHKICDIAALLDSLANEIVTVLTTTYLIHSISRSGVNILGQDPMANDRRFPFTINMLIAISET
jgi:hypothetical protein